ncbi:MAG: hypothetical protein ABEJ76_02405 [Halanaeroarchaeum sp.]
MNELSGTAKGADTDTVLEYLVSVDKNDRTLDVQAEVHSSGPTVFRFEQFMHRGKPDNIDISVTNSATKQGEWEYEVDSIDGTATFSYSIEIANVQDCQGRAPLVLLSERALLVDRESIFASPKTVPGGVGVTVELPDDWALFAAEKKSERRIAFENPQKLDGLFLIAGRPDYNQRVSGDGAPVRYLIFSNSIPCTSNYARDFKNLYDLEPSNNDHEMQSELGFYISRFREIFEQKIPPETIVSPDVSSLYLPDWGLWQMTPERRRHHNARHLGLMYDTLSYTDRFMSKDVNHYFADEIVHEYTGEDRLLGNRYFKFLVFTRGRKIFTFDHSEWPHHNRGYAYQPVQAWYTDHLIKSKSNGDYSLKDVKAYSFKHSVDKQSIPEVVQDIAEIDISDEYSQYVLNEPGKLAEKLPLIKSQYREYLDDLLDYQRLFSKAPDILLYSFIELLTRHPNGLPAKLTIMMRSWPYIDSFRSPGFGGITENADVTHVRDFYDELRSNRGYTRESFLTLLNKYTNGNSSDFFEFYGEHARPPSIKDLNYFLTGDYQKLLSKQMFVRQSMELFEEFVPEDRKSYKQYEEARSKYRISKSKLDTHELEEATDSIEEAISLVSQARKTDESGTGIPDLKAFIHGIDPDKSVDSSALDGIYLDGYSLEWGNFDPIVERSRIRVVEGEESVFVGIPLKEPFYEMYNPNLEIYIKDQSDNTVVQIDLQGKGEALLPGLTDSFALEEYVYIGSELAEIELPKSYLEYNGVEEPSEYVWQTWDEATGLIGKWESIRTGNDQPRDGTITSPARESSTTAPNPSSSHATSHSAEKTKTTSDGFGVVTTLLGALGGFGLFSWHKNKGEESE